MTNVPQDVTGRTRAHPDRDVEVEYYYTFKNFYASKHVKSIVKVMSILLQIIPHLG